MSMLAQIPRTAFRRFSHRTLAVRRYAASSSDAKSPPSEPPSNNNKDVASSSSSSSCPAGTVLTGLNYLKGEPPVLAKPDEEYPAWLWELTKKHGGSKTTAAAAGGGGDDGPGGKAEKRRLRLAHRQTLKDSNMFKVK